jgi:mycofactocin precursor
MLDDAVQPAPAPAPAPDPRAPDQPPTAATDEQRPRLVEADLLVEDVSIDGMCGVY